MCREGDEGGSQATTHYSLRSTTCSIFGSGALLPTRVHRRLPCPERQAPRARAARTWGSLLVHAKNELSGCQVSAASDLKNLYVRTSRLHECAQQVLSQAPGRAPLDSPTPKRRVMQCVARHSMAFKSNALQTRKLPCVDTTRPDGRNDRTGWW